MEKFPFLMSFTSFWCVCVGGVSDLILLLNTFISLAFFCCFIFTHPPPSLKRSLSLSLSLFLFSFVFLSSYSSFFSYSLSSLLSQLFSFSRLIFVFFFFSLSFSLSLCFCLYVWVSLSLSPSLPLSVCVCVFLSPSFPPLSLSLSVFVCVCVSLSLSFSLFLSLCVSLYLSLSPLSLSLFASLYLPVCLSLLNFTHLFSLDSSFFLSFFLSPTIRVWRSSSLRGLFLRALILLGEARFIGWRLRRSFLGECRRNPRHFYECQACLGYSHALRPTLEKALCHPRPFGGGVRQIQ